jgi:hypothetical protein
MDTTACEKESRMNRLILACALLITAADIVGAQEAGKTNPYEGTSRPPADDQITTSQAPESKPSAELPMSASQPVYTPRKVQTETSSSAMAQGGQASSTSPDVQNDNGMVHVAASRQIESNRNSGKRDWADDPDGDIVHPHARRPGEIIEGTAIRVRLLQRLSTSSSEKGEAFRTRVASDVLQDGQVFIPAGAEIDGQVVEVSQGHAGGHGSMRLEPETVILADGTRFQLHAEVVGTQGSRVRVEGEGKITPGSRLKRDGLEYGGAVGAGLVAGAIVGGPGGAAAGGLIGAGAVTVHLLVNHPQATLESGTTLMFTLTEPLDLLPSASSGN